MLSHRTGRIVLGVLVGMLGIVSLGYALATWWAGGAP